MRRRILYPLSHQGILITNDPPSARILWTPPGGLHPPAVISPGIDADNSGTRTPWPAEVARPASPTLVSFASRLLPRPHCNASSPPPKASRLQGLWLLPGTSSLRPPVCLSRDDDNQVPGPRSRSQLTSVQTPDLPLGATGTQPVCARRGVAGTWGTAEVVGKPGHRPAQGRRPCACEASQPSACDRD